MEVETVFDNTVGIALQRFIAPIRNYVAISTFAHPYYYQPLLALNKPRNLSSQRKATDEVQIRARHLGRGAE